ncbi:3-oxoacyl-[acyl-carrier-protein] reductase [Acidocella aquatica]|uniref:3-oxoacyl-[acyl-carrier-protein] reductase n=1 Tax=Acidocella aquatica TaxID=1922313 RepID=A0ABQ6A866_9PROT|nr:SDR family oxidoreductase [Acidocella aquatica]GLR68404.1 3-oxoacyl-[acyl-carrier-protein] reductase [Acidocella aquatica]
MSRNAFVIGGSGGLGSAICRRLAGEWDTVAIGYRSRADMAQALAEEIGAHCAAVPVQCDLGDAGGVIKAIAGFAEKAGGIGTMVFAGGVSIKQPFVSKIGEAAWREVIETELMGFIRVVGATLPIFRRQQLGNFVSVVSVAAHSYPPGDALSAVPKAGIEMLGRAIAKEEGRFGIRANMVAPGIIDAGLGAIFLKDLYSEEIWETQRNRIALRRFGTGDEVAQAVAFLASEQARYITGQTLIVDGGFSL